MVHGAGVRVVNVNCCRLWRACEFHFAFIGRKPVVTKVRIVGRTVEERVPSIGSVSVKIGVKRRPERGKSKGPGETSVAGADVNAAEADAQFVALLRRVLLVSRIVLLGIHLVNVRTGLLRWGGCSGLRVCRRNLAQRGPAGHKQPSQECRVKPGGIFLNASHLPENALVLRKVYRNFPAICVLHGMADYAGGWRVASSLVAQTRCFSATQIG